MNKFINNQQSTAMRNFITLLTVCMCTLTVSAFEYGDGSINNPYQIHTKEELHDFANLINNSTTNSTYNTAYYSLKSNIDLTNDSVSWIPIGNSTNRFKGYFYGNGHTISGLQMGSSTSRYSIHIGGFFGYIENADIQSIQVNWDSFYTNSTASSISYQGGLIGYAVNSRVVNARSNGLISHTNNTVSVKGVCGGLVGGATDTKFIECQSEANVEITTNGRCSAGGFAGSVSSCDIKYCNAKGNVMGKSNNSHTASGGFAGEIGNRHISHCYATGDVYARGYSNSYSGGLIGYTTAIVFNCYALGTVYGNTNTGTIFAGGLVGESINNILNCYARGNVSCQGISTINDGAYSAGIIGKSYKNVTNCYASGNISHANPTTKAYAAGIIGYADKSSINYCYAVNDTIISSTIQNYVTFKTNRILNIKNNGSSLTNCYAKPSMITKGGIYNNEAPVALIKGTNQVDGADFSSDLSQALNNYVLSNPTITINDESYNLYYWHTYRNRGDSLPEFISYYLPSYHEETLANISFFL